MSRRIAITCPHCKQLRPKRVGDVNRARKLGVPTYCSRVCAGLARRTEKLPLAERKAKKAAYDAIRRVQLADEIRAEKREYNARTYTFEKAKAAREARKARHGQHVHRDYCRARFEARPALKRGKRLYDRARRDKRFYADLAEAARVLRQLEALIRERVPSDYERRKARGYYLNLTHTVQSRKRNEQISRW